jgi:tRNA (cytidine/uridine-2'-O-)-methyltransferase
VQPGKKGLIEDHVGRVVIHCALFEPDIPQNAGTILRMGACLGVTVHVIHPCGFALGDRNLRRAGMDYLDRAILREHDDWSAFQAWSQRRVTDWWRSPHAARHPLTRSPSAATMSFCSAANRPACPDRSWPAADAVLRIPIRPGNRSLNVAVAAAISVGEALRQTGQLPD